MGRGGEERDSGMGDARGARRSEVLSSRENRWLKEFRVTLRGGVAAANGAVGVEGVRLVEEALTSGCRVEAVLFSETGERWRERLAPLVGRVEVGFPVLRTTDRLFEGIADTEHPQGVAALVVPRVVTLAEMVRGSGPPSVNNEGDAFEAEPGDSTGVGSELKLTTAKDWRTQDLPSKAEGRAPRRAEEKLKNKPLAGSEFVDFTQVNTSRGCAALLVVLTGVQDPGNVGTIVRTAAAFGATGIVTAASGQSGTASPYAPKALRASAGAALHLPIVTGMPLGILLTQLKMMGIRTVASCVHQAGMGMLAPWEVEWREPIALLVGNEGAGLPEEVVHAADGRIHIPMAKNVESLNAGAAAAVVLYEAYRQRKGKEEVVRG
jgi:tRNA G18 (ribose-2'-O)-methylase SpoU